MLACWMVNGEFCAVNGMIGKGVRRRTQGRGSVQSGEDQRGWQGPAIVLSEAGSEGVGRAGSYGCAFCEEARRRGLSGGILWVVE